MPDSAYLAAGEDVPKTGTYKCVYCDPKGPIQKGLKVLRTIKAFGPAPKYRKTIQIFVRRGARLPTCPACGSDSAKEAEWKRTWAFVSEEDLTKSLFSRVLQLLRGCSVERRLLKSLKSPDPETRGRAAVEIGEMGDAGAFAVAELTKLLEDCDWIVRANAAAALGTIGGTKAKTAVPALTKLLHVKTRDDRTGAVWAHFALARIEGNPKNHLDAIFEELHEIDVDIASAAANALGRLGPVRNVVPRLIREVKIGEIPAEGACLALGLMGSRAKEAVRALTKALKESPYPNVRSAAREALSRIQHA